MNGAISLPSLSEIEALQTSDIPVALAALAAVQGALVARLLAPKEASPPIQSDNAPDVMLTPIEAATMLRKNVKWIYRHNHLPFVRKVGGGLLISRRGLDRWLERQKI